MRRLSPVVAFYCFAVLIACRDLTFEAFVDTHPLRFAAMVTTTLFVVSCLVLVARGEFRHVKFLFSTPRLTALSIGVSFSAGAVYAITFTLMAPRFP